jgi:hypothetical protein
VSFLLRAPGLRLRPLLLVLFLAFLGNGFRNHLGVLGDADTGWHVRVGQEIVHRGVPRTGWFSWTAGDRAWVDHSWLADVLMGAVERFAGLPALVALAAAVFAWAFVRVGGSLLSSGLPGPLALALLLATWFASRGTMLARPQVLTFLFLAEWSLRLRRDRFSFQGWIVLLASAVLWANLHGGVLAGLLLAAWRVPFLFDRTFPGRVRFAGMALLLLSPLVLWATPYGTGLPPALWNILGAFPTVSRKIAEWSPSLLAPSPELLAAVALAALTAFRLRRQLDHRDRLELVFWLALALAAQRFCSPAALAALPLLAHAAARSPAATSRRLSFPERALAPAMAPLSPRKSLAALGLAIVVSIAPLLPPVGRALGITAGMDPRRFPVRVAEETRALARGRRVFQPYDWGGYLIFAWRGEPGVFIDGRYELYRDGLFAECEEIEAGGERAVALLDHHAITLAIVARDGPLDRRLSELGWVRAAEDPCARAYLRP